MSTGESGNNSSTEFDIELDPVLQGTDQVKKTERPQVSMGEEGEEGTQDTQTRSNIHLGGNQSEGLGTSTTNGDQSDQAALSAGQEGASEPSSSPLSSFLNKVSSLVSMGGSTDAESQIAGDDDSLRREPVFSSGTSAEPLDLAETQSSETIQVPLNKLSDEVYEEILGTTPEFENRPSEAEEGVVAAGDQPLNGEVTGETPQETPAENAAPVDDGTTDTGTPTDETPQDAAPEDPAPIGDGTTDSGGDVPDTGDTGGETPDVAAAPVAEDDSFNSVEDATVSLDVLVNDQAPAGGQLFISGVELTEGAGAVTHDGQKVIFNPGSSFDHLAEGESETVTISYSVRDREGQTDTATATLTITGNNDAPVDIALSGNSLFENEAGAPVGSLSASDVDLSDAHSYSVSDDRFEVVDGTLKLKDGVSLDHEAGETVVVTVTARDSSGAEVNKDFQINVADVNERPVASESEAVTGENVILHDQLHASDVDGDEVSFSLVNGPEAGSVTVNADGSYSFDPGTDFDDLAEGEERTVSFKFEVSDGNGGSDVASMDITVTGSNDGPVAAPVELGAIDEDTSLTFSADDLLAKASDIDGDVLAITEVTVEEQYGALTDNGDDTWTFTPAENFNGTDVPFQFEVTDGTDFISSTASLDIVAVNDGPVAAESEAVTGENVILHDQLHASDVDGDEVSFSLVNGPEAGSVTVNADGSYSFDPGTDFDELAEGEERTVSFEFEVTDGNGGSDVASMDITVTGSNDGPVAQAVDLGATNEDTSITFSAEDLLAGASDIDGDILAVTEVRVDEQYGALADNGDGTWTFTPTENFNGADVPFEFDVTDGTDFVSSTASLDVMSVNDAPIVDQTAAPQLSTTEDTAIVIQPADLLGNASDADGDSLSVTNLRIGDQEPDIPVTLKISGDHYDPNNVQDVGVGSPEFEVYVNGELVEVNGETRFDVSAERGDWEYFSFDLPAGTEIDSIDVRFVNDAWEGIGDRDGDGVAGEDRNLIVDKINVGGTQDGTGDFVGGVTIEAEDATYARSSDVIEGRETMAWSGSLQFDMSDVSADDYSALVQNADGSWTYRPDADFNGELSMTYDVVDGNGGVAAATATLTVSPDNDAPVITTSLDGGTPVSLETSSVVLNGDGSSGQLGDNVTIEGFATDGTAATLRTSGDGVGIQGERIDTQIDYDPATGNSEQLVLTFDNPVTEVGLVTARQFENEFPGGEQGKWTAYDADGNEIASGSLTPETGTRLNNNSFSYDLETGDAPVARIVVEATDATGQSSGDNSEFTVKSVSYTEAPDVLADGEKLVTSVAEGAADGTEAATIAATDIDGDALSYAITAGNDDGAFAIDPQSGEVTVADGSLLDHETQASRSLTIEVSDGNGGTDAAELVVNIADVNESPVSAADSFAGTEDQAIAGNVLTNDTDVDGDALSVVAETIETANGGTVEIAADGSFTYTPAENFHGEDSFSYTLSDGSLTDSGTVTLAVAPDNDGPVVGAVDLGATDEDTAVTFSAEQLLANASDVDGDNLSVTGVSVDPAFGSVADNGDGTWTFEPNADFSGDDVPVSFDVTDGTETVSSAASIDVTAVADAPELLLSDTLTLDPDHGNYDLPADGILTVDVSYLSVNAGYNNSHGFYVADADGNPIGGAIIQDNVKDGDDKTVTIDTSDYEGGVTLGFFIIPDGDRKNVSLEDGDQVTFENIDGAWTPMVDGQPLSGQSAPAYFSDQSLNPDGYDHFSDSDSEGNQNWEDLYGGGDGDYTDVNTQVDVALAPHEQQVIQAEVNSATDLPLVKTMLGDQDGSESLTLNISAIPEGATLSDGLNSFTATADNGGVDVTGWDLDHLMVTPAETSDDFTLQVTVTSTEGSNGDAASVTQSINVEIADQVLEGTAGAQNLRGAGGDDTLVYNADSTWSGYAAHNVETGENVSLSGYNRSTDVFDGGSGHDILQGTDGNDALFLDDRISAFASESQARVQDIEEIDMGAGDDILDMTSSRFTYDEGVKADGGEGNDILWTSTGDDTLTGGAGNDAMFGGDGSDMFIFGSNDGNDTVSGGAGWTDVIQLEGFDGVAAEQGWTLTLENGHSVHSTDNSSGEMLLNDDAAGTIIFDDGGEVTFDGIEKIVW